MTDGARFRAQTSDPHARSTKKKCQKQLTLSPAQPFAVALYKGVYYKITITNK
jgi:hypothetical protein